jgi:trans-aconitate methyltransferase
VTTHDPIELLFGGMEKLGPGGDEHTLHMLRRLPARRFDVVVDAGCGTGRQTLALARELGTLVHAVDSHEPFLRDLERRAAQAGLGDLVRTHCMDMREIPAAFGRIDLLWSEGAAYNIGFTNALETWAPALGLAVVSELAWLHDAIPDAARDFFSAGYPDMRGVDANVAAAEAAGYEVLETYTLPAEAWVDGYYDVLEPRARALVDHPDAAVKEMALETISEIETFARSESSYGYVFLVLRRA